MRYGPGLQVKAANASNPWVKAISNLFCVPYLCIPCSWPMACNAWHTRLAEEVRMSSKHKTTRQWPDPATTGRSCLTALPSNWPFVLTKLVACCLRLCFMFPICFMDSAQPTDPASLMYKLRSQTFQPFLYLALDQQNNASLSSPGTF